MMEVRLSDLPLSQLFLFLPFFTGLSIDPDRSTECFPESSDAWISSSGLTTAFWVLSGPASFCPCVYFRAFYMSYYAIVLSDIATIRDM